MAAAAFVPITATSVSFVVLCVILVIAVAFVVASVCCGTTVDA